MRLRGSFALKTPKKTLGRSKAQSPYPNLNKGYNQCAAERGKAKGDRIIFFCFAHLLVLLLTMFSRSSRVGTPLRGASGRTGPLVAHDCEYPLSRYTCRN